MDLVDVMQHCQSLPGQTESTPFGPEVLVFKVGGKIFALLSPDDEPPRVNLKCDPARAELLRGTHSAIVPGYHMNKRHWNTVVLDRSLPPALVRELIDHSYQLVVAGLTARQREEAGLGQRRAPP